MALDNYIAPLCLYPLTSTLCLPSTFQVNREKRKVREASVNGGGGDGGGAEDGLSAYPRVTF